MATSTEPCLYKSLAEIASRLPSTKNGKKLHVTTLSKWITEGARDASGQIVRLEARRYPGGWKLTDRAVEEFLERLTTTALAHLAAAKPSRQGGANAARSRSKAARMNAASAARNQETATPTEPPKNAPVGS